VARFGMQRWAGVQQTSGRGYEPKEASVANGSLTAQATLIQTMRRLVGVKELTEELLKRQETLVTIVVGNATAQVQRSFLLQVLDAEATGLIELVRRLLPQAPPQVTDATPET
jgi:hypothetical protein